MPPVSRSPSSVILCPNLGCPQIIAPEELNGSAVVLVLATHTREQPDWSVYTVKARPSYADEGQPFELGLSKPAVLEDDGLPTNFRNMDENAAVDQHNAPNARAAEVYLLVRTGSATRRGGRWPSASGQR